MRAKRELISFPILLVGLLLLLPTAVYSQDDDYLSPVRPSASESATIQKKGVLQIEYGGDFDFRAPDYDDQQIAPFGVYLAVNKRLRLDFELDTVTSQHSFGRETGIGDLNLDFKTLLRDEPKKHLAVAFAYSLKIPTASDEKGLGTGKFDHELRLIFNRTLGKNDLIVNFSYLNIGRDDTDKRASGAQTVLTYQRELSKKFGLLLEVFGNSVDEQQPRGIYEQTALIYQVNKRLIFDVGARPGFGRDAPKFGLFGGVSFGVGDLFKKK